MREQPDGVPEIAAGVAQEHKRSYVGGGFSQAQSAFAGLGLKPQAGHVLIQTPVRIGETALAAPLREEFMYVGFDVVQRLRGDG
jgi:hypothetical protein